MRSTLREVLVVVGLALAPSGAVSGAEEKPGRPEEPKVTPVRTPRIGGAGVTGTRERWKAFHEHLEKLGKKDLLPEEQANAKPPVGDAIVGVLFRLSPDLAAAQDLLDREPPEVAEARARLDKLKTTTDPYLADYAALFTAQCDLQEKQYPPAARGFERVLASNRNLAAAAAHKGLARCYRAMNEPTLEVLELRFLLIDLPPEAAADRGFAEERLAEIRRDHPGPLEDSAKRIREISKRLGSSDSSNTAESLPGEQKRVEEILEKVAKLLEGEAGRAQAMQQAQEEARAQAKARARKKGEQGKAGAKDQAGAAEKSQVAKKDPKEKKLKDQEGPDADAWGSINEKEVAKALQDAWGRIPLSYRQVVAQYFKDIAGIGTNAAGTAGAEKR